MMHGQKNIKLANYGLLKFIPASSKYGGY